MGIKSLNKFLRNNCSAVYQEVDISEYSFKKIAIDISLYLCKFKIVCGHRWLSAFINLVCFLRKNNIHCVFIYDSKAPVEKNDEKEKRAEHKDKIKQNIFLIEKALEKYYNTGEIDDTLREVHIKEEEKPNRRLLTEQKTGGVDIEAIEFKVNKMKSYILDISPRDFELTKELFRILSVPYYDAPMEAETMCSDLCRRGIVDAVLSEDTDVLAYGTPIFLNNINMSKNTCIRVLYHEVLENLNLTESQFTDLCIMCGTDYNKNIFRVGCEKAYRLLTQYNNIEGIAENTPLDISILNHIRVREIFTEYEQYNITEIEYCGIPDFEELSYFFAINNIPLEIESLRRNFCNQNIIFDE
jgi:5'-3' exonuclease